MRSVLFIAGIAVFIAGLWLIAIPGSWISAEIEKAAQGSAVSVEISDLHKGLFYSFTSRSITIRKSGKTLVSIDKVKAKFNPVELLLLRVPLTFEGEMGGGKISGRLVLKPLQRRMTADVTLDNADISGIPFFAAVGMKGKGLISGSSIYIREKKVR